MSGEQASEVDAEAKGVTRQRSTISFPYMDLKSAMEIAHAIHAHVGLGDCDDDQLAAWTDQSSKSSTFRVQVYASRTFGVIEGEPGRHRLTDLGRAIIDPSREREAKVRAFLNVQLYKSVFENYKGGVIPPAAALERDMVKLGVAEKQKDRARQVFERSAEQAGFFEHGKNRLVAPGIQTGKVAPPASEAREEVRRHDNLEPGNGAGGGAGSGGPGTGNAVLDALVQTLPKAGAAWNADERLNWLTMVAMAFNMAYGQSDRSISITTS